MLSSIKDAGVKYFKKVFNVPKKIIYEKDGIVLQKPLTEIIWSYTDVVKYYLTDDKDFKIAGGVFVGLQILFYIIFYIINMKTQPGFNTPYRVSLYTNLCFMIIFNLFTFIGSIIESVNGNDAYWWCSVLLTLYPLVMLIIMSIIYFPGSKSQNSKRTARFGGERFCCLPINQVSCCCFLPNDEYKKILSDKKLMRIEERKSKESSKKENNQNADSLKVEPINVFDNINAEMDSNVKKSDGNCIDNEKDKITNIRHKEYLNKTAPLFAYRQFLTAILWTGYAICSYIFCMVCTKYTIPPTKKEAYDCFTAIFGINLFYQMVSIFLAIVEFIMLFVLIFLKTKKENDAEEIKQQFIKDLRIDIENDIENIDEIDHIGTATASHEKLVNDFV